MQSPNMAWCSCPNAKYQARTPLARLRTRMIDLAATPATTSFDPFQNVLAAS